MSQKQIEIKVEHQLSNPNGGYPYKELARFTFPLLGNLYIDPLLVILGEKTCVNPIIKPRKFDSKYGLWERFQNFVYQLPFDTQISYRVTTHKQPIFQTTLPSHQTPRT